MSIGFILGYVMTVLGMYFTDFRRTYMRDEKEICYRKVFLESAIIYLIYYLLLKDALMKDSLNMLGISITITEKSSLGLNIILGALGYDKLYKHFIRRYRRRRRSSTIDKDDE